MLEENKLGEKYVAEKDNPKNSGHFVPQHCLRAAYALRSDQCSSFPGGGIKVPQVGGVTKLLYIIFCNQIFFLNYITPLEGEWEIYPITNVAILLCQHAQWPNISLFIVTG